MSARDVIALWLDDYDGSRDVVGLKSDADAILSALDAAGYAVVPKEPTANMLADGALMALTTERHAQRVWEVMITAAEETR